jgi:hypothetical protein
MQLKTGNQAHQKYCSIPKAIHVGAAWLARAIINAAGATLCRFSRLEYFIAQLYLH